MTKQDDLPLEAIRELYQQGLSRAAIGDRYHVSEQTVGRFLVAHGIELRRELEVPIEEVVALYESGMSTAAIGEQVGVSPQTILRRLQRVGKYRKRSPKEWVQGRDPIPIDEERLRLLASQHLSTREIAAELEVSEECVRLRMVSLDIPRLPAKARPERNHFWKGGQPFQDPDGYTLVRCPDHPFARKSGYIFLHRLVMEEKLGRYLLPHEVVHHGPGGIQDNSPENLTLFENNAAHLQETLKGHVPKWTPEGRERIRLGHPSLKKKASSTPAESRNGERGL